MKDYISYNGYLSRLNKSDLKTLFMMLEEYKLIYKYNLGLPENVSFGVEVEFQNVLLDNVQNEIRKDSCFKYWYSHKDASVSIETEKGILGGEVSTDILHDIQDDWINLHNLFDILNLMDAKATNKTAFHIHVGAHIFKDDLKYAIRFIKLWCIFENIIYRFGYGKTALKRPHIDIFAPPIARLYRNNYLHNDRYFENMDSTYELDYGKKRAVNFKNYHYLYTEEEVNNTIEIRTPNGTLDPIIAQNNVNFFIKLMLYVTSNKYDEDLIDGLFARLKYKTLEEYSKLDIKTALFLSDLIFDNSLDKIDFLSQYIKKDDYIYLR
ncbi:MAG: hypothetical protein E7163_01370 [Firmicutes bacterium]|nr:hypothetical protein [Bacillota bacterium]